MQTDPRKGFTSASNAAQDSACPGRFQAQRLLPERASDDADYGQIVHEALRSGDASKLTIDQRDVFDSCQAIEQKVVLAVFGDKATTAVFREQRYWVNVLALGVDGKTMSQFPHSGQADAVYRSGTKALIVDYKVLQGDVEDSPKNMQLRDLACLVKGHFVTVNQIATVIIQPLVTHKPEVCLYDDPDLKRAESEMFARVAASNAPDAKRVAGEVQCKFCLAKGKCQPYSAWVGAMIPTGELEPVVKELIFKTAMESWTPNQRAMAASLLAPAGKALDEIKEHLKTGLANDPAFVPGWELKEGSNLETITDPQACFDRFAALGGVLPVFMNTVKVGKTKLKEAVSAVTGHRGKQLNDTMYKLTAGIVAETRNAPSLVKVKEGK